MTREATAEKDPQAREILIADSNPARGQRLVEACVEFGMRAVTVPHGSAALEHSLTTPPDLIVAEIDLPLVCGPKLAEILRANPRTRSVRFLFLGSEGGSANRTEVGDATIAISAPREQVLQLIAEQLAKSDRMHALETASLDGGNASGDLAKLPLVDLLQVAHLARKSGRVDLEREGDGEGIALAEEDAASDHLDRGFVSLRDGEVLRAEIGNVVGEKALYRMLAWREGRFVFDTTIRPDDKAKILAPVRALLAEGMRQIEEWDRLALQLPPLSATVKLSIKTSELPNIVHPLTQEVLLLLEHFERVREIVNRCSFPDYQVLRTLHTLAQRNIVSVDQLPVRGLAPNAAGDALFDEGQQRRLRDRLQGVTPRGEPIVSGKILVVARGPGLLTDLLKLLQAIPNFEPRVELGRGSPPKIELGPLGRICLDGDLEIELLQVPSANSYRPLWPVAAHGALATLFLHGGAVSDVEPGDGEFLQVLQQGTGANALHVVLLERKQSVCPDEVLENLALLDEASLFLIPLEAGKEPTALLRSLFARAVP